MDWMYWMVLRRVWMTGRGRNNGFWGGWKHLRNEGFMNWIRQWSINELVDWVHYWSYGCGDQWHRSGSWMVYRMVSKRWQSMNILRKWGWR